MNIKKSLSFLLAAGILAGSLYAVPDITGIHSPFISPLVAKADSQVLSGKMTDISYKCTDERATLYFVQDPTDNHLEICGCQITESGVSVIIPDTVNVNGTEYPVTAISKYAFHRQINLNDITNSSGMITSIGDAAFYNCTSLTNCYFTMNNSPSVKFIGDSAFSGCSSLQSSYFAKNAEHIGSHAFWDCTSLEQDAYSKIKLDKVSYLGKAAFSNCCNAEGIDISEAPLTILPEYAFYNCKNAKEIHLPECLTSIGEHAISECDSFQEIYIPDSVTNIKRGAFYECDMLKTVMMSESIISVGDYAFFCCPNMNYFVSKNPNATIGYYALGYHLENTHLVMNTDFVVWSTGTGRVKNYASNYDLTFRNISDAASLSTEHYKNYEWGASNLGYNWAKGDKYYFNSAHTPYANGHAGENFNGICSGLSIVSVLTASGRLQISDFAPGCSKLRDTTQKGIPYDLRSYITTVWANSGLINNSLLYDYKLDSDNRFGKEMMRYAEYITYGADPSIIGIWGGGDSAHSVVCFGMEYRENASDKNDACWDGWDARIMIYDVNRSVHDKTDYIYVNLSSGEWSSLLSVRYGTSGKPMHIEMTHSYDKMLNVGKYNMTVEEFFEAIRN